VNLHYESFFIERPCDAAPKNRIDRRCGHQGKDATGRGDPRSRSIPCAQIRAFALVRTLGLIPAVQQLLDPCRGKSDGGSVMRIAAHSARRAKMKRITPVPVDHIVRSILILRGQRVILDAELATLYGVATKRLNEASQAEY